MFLKAFLRFGKLINVDLLSVIKLFILILPGPHSLHCILNLAKISARSPLSSLKICSHPVWDYWPLDKQADPAGHPLFGQQERRQNSGTAVGGIRIRLKKSLARRGRRSRRNRSRAEENLRKNSWRGKHTSHRATKLTKGSHLILLRLERKRCRNCSKQLWRQFRF